MGKRIPCIPHRGAAPHPHLSGAHLSPCGFLPGATATVTSRRRTPQCCPASPGASRRASPPSPAHALLHPGNSLNMSAQPQECERTMWIISCAVCSLRKHRGSHKIQFSNQTRSHRALILLVFIWEFLRLRAAWRNSISLAN